MSNITSKATINSLRNSFATHGLPHFILMDGGTSFTSNEFKMLCTMNGIKHYCPLSCMFKWFSRESGTNG